MDQGQRQQVWAAWYAWAIGETRGDEARAFAVATAAIGQLDAGLGQASALTAARAVTVARIGGPAPADDELAHIDYILQDLDLVEAAQLDQKARAYLQQRYRRRRTRLAQRAKSAPEARPGAAVAAAPAESTPAAIPAEPAVPGRGLQGWIEDQGILILSYIGAFLLIVATILFEVYGLRGLDGTIQFLAVLALNLFFGVLGYLCLPSQRLRIVGRTYIAIFALMAPLVVVAAYVFLQLRSRGISPDTGLLLGGMYSAVLYGVIATRLRSAGYGWMSLAAVAFAAVGAAGTVDRLEWGGVMLALAAVLHLLLYGVAADRPAWSPFKTAARVLPLVVGPIAILWSLLAATSDAVRGLPAGDLLYPYLPLTFAILGGACVLHARLTHRAWLTWAVPSALSLTLVSANFTARGDSRSLGLVLLAMAWVYALAAEPARRFGLADFMRAGAAAQVLCLLLITYDSAGAQALVLIAGTAAGAWLALQSKQSWWSIVPGVLFVDAWYWSVRAVVPPPPNPGPDTLALVLSPIPLGLRGSRDGTAGLGGAGGQACLGPAAAGPLRLRRDGGRGAGPWRR